MNYICSLFHKPYYPIFETSILRVLNFCENVFVFLNCLLSILKFLLFPLSKVIKRKVDLTCRHFLNKSILKHVDFCSHDNFITRPSLLHIRLYGVIHFDPQLLILKFCLELTIKIILFSIVPSFAMQHLCESYYNIRCYLYYCNTLYNE